MNYQHTDVIVCGYEQWSLFCVRQFGDKGKLYLVRFLNSTVMVRVGGGWITLASFLTNNDPCRGQNSSLTSRVVHCQETENARRENAAQAISGQ